MRCKIKNRPKKKNIYDLRIKELSHLQLNSNVISIAWILILSKHNFKNWHQSQNVQY